jgi:hypothetical protein
MKEFFIIEIIINPTNLIINIKTSIGNVKYHYPHNLEIVYIYIAYLNHY